MGLDIILHAGVDIFGVFLALPSLSLLRDAIMFSSDLHRICLLLRTPKEHKKKQHIRNTNCLALWRGWWLIGFEVVSTLGRVHASFCHWASEPGRLLLLPTPSSAPFIGLPGFVCPHRKRLSGYSQRPMYAGRKAKPKISFSLWLSLVLF